MTVVIDPSALVALERDPTGPVQRHLRSLADRTALKAKQNLASSSSPLARPSTGRTAAGIQVRSESDGSWTVISTAPWSMALHEGADPHPIPPSASNALRFFWKRTGLRVVVPKDGGFKTFSRGGVLVIGKGRVDHPGTKPRPFLLNALEDTVRSAIPGAPLF